MCALAGHQLEDANRGHAISFHVLSNRLRNNMGWGEGNPIWPMQTLLRRLMYSNKTQKLPLVTLGSMSTPMRPGARSGPLLGLGVSRTDGPTQLN